jgi:hypothetical protein
MSGADVIPLRPREFWSHQIGHAWETTVEGVISTCAFFFRASKALEPAEFRELVTEQLQLAQEMLDALAFMVEYIGDPDISAEEAAQGIEEIIFSRLNLGRKAAGQDPGGDSGGAA